MTKDSRPLFQVILFFLVACVPTGHALATLSLESSFTVTGTYTDNLFFDANNKKDDFGTLFGPNLSIQFANADVVLGAAYAGRLGVFVNNPNANKSLHNVNLILDLPFLNKLLKGLTVSIDETMRFTPQLDAFSGSSAENISTRAFRAGSRTGTRPEGSPSLWSGGTQGVFTTRNNAFLNRAALTASYAWTPRVSSSLGYRNQYRRFSSNDFQDSVAHIGTFSLPYLVQEGTTLTPSYSYRQIDFIGGGTQSTSADKIISHSTQLGISHALTPSLTGTIKGGVAWTKQQGAEETARSSGGGTRQQSVSDQWATNFVGSASITKRFRLSSLSLNVGQSIGGGGGLGSQATRTRTATGSLSHTFTRRLTGSGSVGYAQNVSVDGNAFDTTTYRIQSRFTYVFLRWLSGNIGYTYTNQNSKGSAANDLTVNQVFLGLTAFADPWIPIR